MKLRILSFLAIAFFSQTVFAEDEVGEVRADETEKISRRFTSRQFNYLAIGPFALENSNNTAQSHHLGLGYVWDSSVHASVKAIVEGVFNFKKPKTAILNFGLGANYFLTASPVSPFIGGDFGYGQSITNDDSLKSVSGFSIGGAAGIAFFRTAGTQLQVQFRKQMILEKNGVGNPGYYGFSLALLY
jgi:hypothetical protein